MTSGIVHINEPNIPFGRLAAPGAGGIANLEALPDTRRVTVRGDRASYPC